MAKAHETLANCRAFKGSSKDITDEEKSWWIYVNLYICICNYMYLYMVPCSIYLFVVSFCNVRTQALQPTKVVSIAKVAPVVSLESWFLHWNSNSENPPNNFPSGKFTNPKEILQNLREEPVAPLGTPSALPTAATMPLHQCWRAPHCKWGCRTLAPDAGNPWSMVFNERPSTKNTTRGWKLNHSD